MNDYQLQGAVTARFDRVERTLAQMEKFLDFQKPILRLDFYFELAEHETSATLGSEAIRLRIHGLEYISKTLSCLCAIDCNHASAKTALVTSTYMWSEDSLSKILPLIPSLSSRANLITSFCEFSLTTGGQRVKMIDFTILGLEAHCTNGIRSKIRRVAIDANGYELFCCVADGQGEPDEINWAEDLPLDANTTKWVNLVRLKQRNLLFDLPALSGRFSPIQHIKADS